MHLDAAVRIWWEISNDGQVWGRPSAAPQTAYETARNPEELRALIRAYTATMEGVGAVRRREWVRLIVQGAETGRMLAVVPRRMNTDTGRYESTGGEWQVTDQETDLSTWVVDLTRHRIIEATPLAA